jgi:hypothetical protein
MSTFPHALRALPVRRTESVRETRRTSTFAETLRQSSGLLMFLMFAVVYGFIGIEIVLLVIATPLSIAALLLLIFPTVALVAKGIMLLLDDSPSAH